jgi:hypothetical protein
VLNRQDAKFAKEDICFFICGEASAVEKPNALLFFAFFAPLRFNKFSLDARRLRTPVDWSMHTAGIFVHMPRGK